MTHLNLIHHLHQLNQHTDSTTTTTTKTATSLDMESYVGLIKVRLIRGINLVVRDSRTSDPYVTLTMGDKVLKTKVVRSDCNPEWNDQLTLGVTSVHVPIKLEVFDEDTFTKHDNIGEANIDINSYLDCMRKYANDPSEDGNVVARVQPNTLNCLSKESCIAWKSGKLAQDMTLRLKNVDSGEVELQIEWVDLPGGSSSGGH